MRSTMMRQGAAKAKRPRGAAWRAAMKMQGMVTALSAPPRRHAATALTARTRVRDPALRSAFAKATSSASSPICVPPLKGRVRQTRAPKAPRRPLRQMIHRSLDDASNEFLQGDPTNSTKLAHWVMPLPASCRPATGRLVESWAHARGHTSSAQVVFSWAPAPGQSSSARMAAYGHHALRTWVTPLPTSCRPAAQSSMYSWAPALGHTSFARVACSWVPALAHWSFARTVA